LGERGVVVFWGGWCGWWDRSTKRRRLLLVRDVRWDQYHLAITLLNRTGSRGVLLDNLWAVWDDCGLEERGEVK